MVEPGEKYRDTVTGFVGTAVARTVWLRASVRVTLASDKLHDGKPVDYTFDEGRLEPMDPIARADARVAAVASAPQADPSA